MSGTSSVGPTRPDAPAAPRTPTHPHSTCAPPAAAQATPPVHARSRHSTPPPPACGPAALVGGGPALGTGHVTSAVLCSLLTASQPTEAPAAGPLRQLVEALSGRIAQLAAAVGLARDGRADLAAVSSAPAEAAPLQPPAPGIVPQHGTFTFDVERGTIVGADPAAADDAAHADGSVPPSSWLPIAGLPLPRLGDIRAGSIVDRIDALLRELGVTRLQFLVLTLAVPAATAFLIQVVQALLGDG